MLLTGRLLIDWVTKRGKRLKKGNKGGLTHVEVEPILWLRTKQIMARIKIFSYSLNAHVSTALAQLPHTLSPLFWKLDIKMSQYH